MKNCREFSTICALCLLLCHGAGAQANSGNTLFDKAWKFALEASDEAKETAFDDGAWRELDLPHDWSIEFPTDENAPAGNSGGYYPTGTGWYRKTFDSHVGDGRKLLYFEGAYMNVSVYVNGQLAGEHPYGYTSFLVDMTPFIKEGSNVVAVRVDNSEQANCRWYSGSGIYRHVWFIDEPAVHIEHQSSFVTTPHVSAASATVRVGTIVVNGSDVQYDGPVEICLTKDGAEVGRASVSVSLAKGQSLSVSHEFNLNSPELWGPDSPELYNASIRIASHSDDVVFGIRSIRWNAAEGLVLNGQRILLNGGCVHHDNGMLGAASYDDAEYRKAELLKKAGFNAVRTSHNPPAPAFLDACDRLGILVIDESFDGWREEKSPFDYSRIFDAWYLQDVHSMVMRDRNHPSIFCWSTGNEVIERKSIGVVKTAKQLISAIHDCDTTRPITSALASWDRDWDIYDPLADVHDIVGYNYMIHQSAKDHERVPQRVMMQTESYPRDAYSNWEYCQENGYIVGDFVWTAIDYLGESGIGKYYYKGDPRNNFHLQGQYPYHGAYCGDIDITGWRKPISYYRDMLWNWDGNDLYLCVREPDGYRGEVRTTGWSAYPTWESWDFPGWEGKTAIVEVYTKAPEVKLYLNDKLIGTKNVDKDSKFIASFEVPYEPGVLRAEAGGATRTLSTPGKPYSIRLTASKTVLKADSEQLSFVEVEIVDRKGNVCPDAEIELSFAVSGAGKLLSTGNANMEDRVPYTSSAHSTWKGRAMAVVLAGDKGGKCRLTVSANGLKPSRVEMLVD